MAIAGFTCFLLGIILIIIYLSISKKHSRCSAQTQGMLKDIRKNRSRDSNVGRDEYYYSYHVNGMEYQLKTFDRSPQTDKIGDHCTIWYNPKKPKDALAHYYDSMKFFKIFLFGGIATIILGLIMAMIGVAH